MTPHAHAALFGSLCLLAALVVAVACIRKRLAQIRAEDESLAVQRLPGEGEPLSVEPSEWAPTAAMWGESATPIYESLCFEQWEAEMGGGVT